MTENLVPWLRSGTGGTPQDGGCIMQVVDWVHRGGWTDEPPCVHPVIQRLAISANDSLDDAGRQRLLDLAPRMMGTASDDKRLCVQLAVFCAEWVLPIYEARYGDGRARARIGAAREWLRSGKKPAAAAASAAVSYAATYAAAYAAYAADAAYDDAAYDDAAADAATAATAALRYAADGKSGGNARYDLLVAALDEHDRITGRDTDPGELNYAPVCAAMAGAT